MSDENKLTVTTPHQTTTLRIPGDTVNKATADLPDNQRSAIRRLHAHYIENELTLEETGKLIGMSDTSITLLFRGKYPAKLDNIVEEIEAFFALNDKRSQGRKLNFIHTSLTKRIWNVCDAAVEFQKIAFIFGDSQIGKTESLMSYRDEHNHGSTIYTSMPTGGSLSNYLIELARQLRIGENLSVTRLRERVKGAFDDRMLLIVDEGHQCVRDYGRSTRPIQTIEFIRELFNERKCGVIIAATNVFRDAMDAGPVEKILRQTKRRRLCTLQLPNAPTQADLNTFAAAYKLQPSTGVARDLEKAMIETEALGMWLTLMRMGAKIAAQRKQPMNWNHVLDAHAGLKHLESGK